MKHNSYSYKVIVNFTLAREEIDHLLVISARHYDGKCRDAGKQGGFIYGWMNRLNFARTERSPLANEIELEATIQQLDTVTKILEMDFDPNYRLRTAFNELAQNAVRESQFVNDKGSQAFLKKTRYERF